MHTCQHLEIRNQDTFIIALTPTDQIDCALHSAPKCTSHSNIWFRLKQELSSQFAEKRPGKRLIYVLHITFKQEYLLTENLENRDVPIFEVLKVNNRNCPNKIRTVGRYDLCDDFGFNRVETTCYQSCIVAVHYVQIMLPTSHP